MEILVILKFSLSYMSLSEFSTLPVLTGSGTHRLWNMFFSVTKTRKMYSDRGTTKASYKIPAKSKRACSFSEYFVLYLTDNLNCVYPYPPANNKNKKHFAQAYPPSAASYKYLLQLLPEILDSFPWEEMKISIRSIIYFKINPNSHISYKLCWIGHRVSGAFFDCKSWTFCIFQGLYIAMCLRILGLMLLAYYIFLVRCCHSG